MNIIYKKTIMNETEKILSTHDLPSLLELQAMNDSIERWTLKGDNFEQMEDFQKKIQERIENLLNN